MPVFGFGKTKRIKEDARILVQLIALYRERLLPLPDRELTEILYRREHFTVVDTKDDSIWFTHTWLPDFYFQRLDGQRTNLQGGAPWGQGKYDGLSLLNIQTTESICSAIFERSASAIPKESRQMQKILEDSFQIQVHMHYR